MTHSSPALPAQAGGDFSLPRPKPAAAGARSAWVPLTVEGLRAILYEIRPADLAEIEAVMPRGQTPWASMPFLAESSVIGAIFTWNNWPAAALGFCEIRPGVFEGWSWGTVHYTDCAPAMAEFIRSVALPALIRADVHRIQASSLAGYAEAHRWIDWLGLKREGVLHGYGSDGSDFVTFAWVKGQHGNVPSLRGGKA